MDSQNQMVEIAPGFFVRSWDEIERAEIDPFVRPGTLLVYLKTSTQSHHVAAEHVPATLKAWRKHFGINSPFDGDYPEDEPLESQVKVGQHWLNSCDYRYIVLGVFTAIHGHPKGGQYSFEAYPPAQIDQYIRTGETVVVFMCKSEYYMTTESHFLDGSKLLFD